MRLAALVAALGAVANSAKPPQVWDTADVNVKGERILIVGDSLTAHSAATPAIWNVDADTNRVSSTPGDLLASALLEQGAEAVRTDGRVGRSAYNFWQREAAGDIIAADIAWKPTKVIVMLGTNDVGLGAAPDKAAFEALRTSFANAGAEVWAIGPFQTVQDAAQQEIVVSTMKSVFGGYFIDGRPLSAYAAHGGDGIHYTATGARTLALALATKLTSTMSPATLWTTVGMGMLGLGLAVIGSTLIHRHRNRTALLGEVDLEGAITILDGKRYDGNTTTLVRKGYKQIACASGLDKKGLANCWTKGGLAAPAALKPRARAKRVKELNGELQQLYRRGGYAGNTAEQSAAIEADISKLREKIYRLETTGLEGSNRAPRTGPNAAIDSRAEHAWAKIQTAHSHFPGKFDAEYEMARKRVFNDDPWEKTAWDQDEPFVQQLEKTARSVSQRAAKLRKSSALTAG